MLILLFLSANRKVNDISGSEVTTEQGFSTSQEHDCYGEVVQTGHVLQLLAHKTRRMELKTSIKTGERLRLSCTESNAIDQVVYLI